MTQRVDLRDFVEDEYCEDVKEVASGYECGLVFEKFNDLQEDDMIEAYAMVEVPR